jgi:uncharacterized protein (TIGR02145 family)
MSHILKYFIVIISFSLLHCSGDATGSNSEPNGTDIDDLRIESIKLSPPEDSVLVDSRDGQEYNLFYLDERWWFVDNLNFESNNSMCFDNLSENCLQQGRLYLGSELLQNTSDTALCPEGFTIPNNEDWGSLFDHLTGLALLELREDDNWSNLLNQISVFNQEETNVPFVDSYTGYVNGDLESRFPESISWWSNSLYVNNSDLRHLMEVSTFPQEILELSFVFNYEHRAVRCVSLEE